MKKLADNVATDDIEFKSAYILATLYMGQQDHAIDHQQAERYFEIVSGGATKD